MAKRKKKLNKNLVAFLTVMGMLLVVSVFGLVVWQQSWRDPALLAEEAARSEADGDLTNAMRYYMRAYAASNELEVSYLIDGMECVFELGDIRRWRSALARAHSRFPEDTQIITAMLDGLWRIRAIRGAGLLWEDWRDYGRRLHELEQDSVYGLVSHAMGLWGLGGEENIATGDELLEEAISLEPNNPKVALARLIQLRREGREKLQDAVSRRVPQRQIEQIQRDHEQRGRELLEQAWAAHPGHRLLASAYVEFVEDRQRRLEVLEQALEANPKAPSLHVALARQLLMRLQDSDLVLEASEAQALRSRAQELIAEAIELDPALFDAYALRASMELIQRNEAGEIVQPDDEAVSAAVAQYEDARRATQILQGLRAILIGDARINLLRNGFNLALRHSRRADDADVRQERIDKAAAFLEDAKTKYPEHPFTIYMEGQLATANNDTIAAIKAFERAHEYAGDATLWDRARVEALPSEMLALLYAEGDAAQVGMASRWADRALTQYVQELQKAPPPGIVLARAELYLKTNEAQEALDLLEMYESSVETLAQNNDARLRAVRAQALMALDRHAEARELIEEDELVSPIRSRLAQAQIAISEADVRGGAEADRLYTDAVNLLKGAVEDPAATQRERVVALQSLISTLERADRNAEARELIERWLENPPEGVERLLRSYEIVLANEDPAQRDARLLEIIGENPDPAARNQEYYNFYSGRGQPEKALEYLDALQESRPDDLRLVEREFYDRLALQQFDKAGALIPRLSQHNDGSGFDRAGGATYRGELALVRGDGELAAREFEHALRMLPRSDSLQIKLGRALLLAGLMTEGVEALEAALDLNPRSFEACWYLRRATDQMAGTAVGERREALREKVREYTALAAELRPDHPSVKQWVREQREIDNPRAAIQERVATWGDRPDKWAEDEGALQNALRLADLFAVAWDNAVRADDRRGQQQILQQAETFFDEAMAESEGRLNLRFVQRLAGMYVDGSDEHHRKAERLLRDAVDRQESAELKLVAQLILAGLYEDIGDPASAEREYREAQRLTAEAADDPAGRWRLERQVGLAFTGLYERQRAWPQMAEVSRWMLDRHRAAGVGDDGDARRFRLRLIQGLLNAKQFADAEREVETYIDAYGAEGEQILSVRAELRRAQGRRDDAYADLTMIVERHRNNPWAYLTRGSIDLERGLYDKAERNFAEAEKHLAQAPGLELSLRDQQATLSIATGENDLALQRLERMVELFESAGARSAELQRVVTRMVRLLSDRMDEFEQAQELVSEYKERYPEDPVWPRELAQLFERRASQLEREGDIGEAREMYEQAARYYRQVADLVPPDNIGIRAGAIREVLDVLTRGDQAREAVSTFERLPETLHAPSVCVAAAKAYQAVNRNAEARSLWKKALADASKSNLRSVRSIAYDARQSIPADAMGIIKELRADVPADSPSSVRLKTAMAELQLRSGEAEKALPLYEELLKEWPERQPERLDVLLSYAQCLEAVGRTADAISTYEKVLDAQSNNLAALNNLAYLLVNVKDEDVRRPKEALAYAERLRDMIGGTPNDATLYDTLGWVHYHNDNIDLAIASLEQAVLLAGDEASAKMHLHLGMAYAAQGRTPDARAEYERGLAAARASGDTNREEDIQALEAQLQNLQ